ncbi:hypothetical protein AGMMS4956_14290 [Bacteroidia bacterium]|nr:hypothetical protein AGMMS4956_14290 [Bacteroidia bacterium]
MKTYLLTSPLFEGVVTLHYNDEGLYVGMSIEGSLTEQQREWLLRYTSANIDAIKTVLGGSKTATLTALPPQVQQITFELFWDKYDDKVNSSKKKALAKWEKMSKTEQQRAYLYLPKYFGNLPNGTRKKYVETYLNAELWNN